jgi:ABC-type multidrug transport system fused ATPase/permease subunit
MQSSSSLLEDRVIFYKHFSANFYSAWPFVLGRTISQLPQTIFDTMTFSTLIYFFVGLAGRDSASNYFIYLSLLIVFAVTVAQNLNVFAAFADSGSLSALSACLVLLLVLFGGFIVPPNVIPGYYSWLYWWNPFAWVYRGVVVNEFRSGRWGDTADMILETTGFTDPQGEPFGQEWIGYAFAYLLPYSVLCSVLTALILTFVRNEGGKTAVPANQESSNKEEESGERISIPFKPVTLSFSDVCYDVKASTGSDTLRLLKNVNGLFLPHRMCALMGESGAGKESIHSSWRSYVCTFSHLYLLYSTDYTAGCHRLEEAERNHKRRSLLEWLATRLRFFPTLFWICGAV